MKSQIYIKIGSYNKDLTEASPEELKQWLRLLDTEELINTVIILTEKVKEKPLRITLVTENCSVELAEKIAKVIQKHKRKK